MTNMEMINRLSNLELELKEKVFNQTGKNSQDALHELNKTRNLIIRYAVEMLDENDAKYKQAVTDLADVMTTLNEAEADIHQVAQAIATTAKVLDVVEKLAAKAAA